MRRTVLTASTIRAVFAKWNDVAEAEKYYESDNATFPAALGYFHEQGWDLCYHGGSYSIPNNQLDFFLLSL